MKIVKTIILLIILVYGKEHYEELLNLKPLPHNKLLSIFDFKLKSNVLELDYNGNVNKKKINHKKYNYFPKTLVSIIEKTNTRELHIRFSQGKWRHKKWGKMPYNGFRTGGVGIEFWGTIETTTLKKAEKYWIQLIKTLSGIFCTSLDLRYEKEFFFSDFFNKQFLFSKEIISENNQLFSFKLILPEESVCTENLIPFLKMLPTKGKHGISSLLSGHSIFSSLWNSMSLDLITQCHGYFCELMINQSILLISDIENIIQKKKNNGIQKPIPVDEMRCNMKLSKDVWHCFPINILQEIEWSLESIFGKLIAGPAFKNDYNTTSINTDINLSNWNSTLIEIDENNKVISKLKNVNNLNLYSKKKTNFNIEFSSNNTFAIGKIDFPSVYVDRSLTGYSRDKGGFLISFVNASSKNKKVLYHEVLPWYTRLYLSTFSETVTVSNKTYINGFKNSKFIKKSFFKPGMDRIRSSYLDLEISLPANLKIIITYRFTKSLLLYHEYPSDPNHGFVLKPSIAVVLNEKNEKEYETRTNNLLITLATPDFSMPYNVIILTCTMMSLVFGSIFNLLMKITISETDQQKILKKKIPFRLTKRLFQHKK